MHTLKQRLKLYDTLDGSKRTFEPVDGDTVRIYQCGPTVYDHSHIGHCRPLVVYDVLVRYLKYLGNKVIHVENFTDIDDKLIDRSRDEQRDPLVIADRYIEEYLRLTDQLNVLRADHYPRVSRHIDEIIEMTGTLIEKGHAYVVEGNVFFDVTTFSGYGKLSGRRLEEARAGTRIEVDQRKRHPVDFTLWKAAKPGEPSWDSPWGRGRPGWHIECSAMSIKYLGVPFDIHGGGADLIFPHHENEIAQAEAYAERPFVRFWMHTGLLNVNEEKMGKSTGNMIRAKEVLSRYPGPMIRFFLLSTHYRAPLEYSLEQLEDHQRAWLRLNRVIRSAAQVIGDLPEYEQIQASLWQPQQQPEGPDEQTPRERFEALLSRLLDRAPERLAADIQDKQQSIEEALADDLNTARVVGTLFELSHDVNRRLNQPLEPSERIGVAGAVLCLQQYAALLGITKTETSTVDDELSSKLVELLIELRDEARQNENWGQADAIRDRLEQLGIRLKDTPQGTRWTVGEPAG